MTVYALVSRSGIITGLVSPPDGSSISDLPYLTTAQKASAVVVPDASHISVGWTYDGSVFAPPGGYPVPTTADQASTMLNAGLNIQSRSDPSLDARYDCSPSSQLLIIAEMMSLVANRTFADGTTLVHWPDIAGVDHVMNPVQFQAFATQIGLFISVLTRIRRSGKGSFPSNTASIP